MDLTPSPLSRVGQALWAALNYITVTVGRYLRPEPANPGNYDTQTGQEAVMSVMTDEQRWTKRKNDKDEKEGKEREEKVLRETDKESGADAWDSGSGHKTTGEWCSVSIPTETDTKTDQYVVKYIKGAETEKAAEGGEDICISSVGKEETDQRQNVAYSSYFTDDEKEGEIERCDRSSKQVLETEEHISLHSSFEDVGRGERGNTEADYYRDESGREQNPGRREEKVQDKETVKLFPDEDGEEHHQTKERNREREGEHDNLIRTDEVSVIRGAEKETEDVRGLEEEVVKKMDEDDKMDRETKEVRAKEGTEEKIQSKGKEEDRGKEVECLLVNEGMEDGEEDSVVWGRQGSVKETYDIEEEQKEEQRGVRDMDIGVLKRKKEMESMGDDMKDEDKGTMEMRKRLSDSGKLRELEKKDVRGERGFLELQGREEIQSYGVKEDTQQIFFKRQYGDVSEKEEGKNNDGEDDDDEDDHDDELPSAAEIGEIDIPHVERRGEEIVRRKRNNGGERDKRSDVKAEAETYKVMSGKNKEERMCVSGLVEGNKEREEEGSDEEIGVTDRVKDKGFGETLGSNEDIREYGESPVEVLLIREEQEVEFIKRDMEVEKECSKDTKEFGLRCEVMHERSEDKIITEGMVIERMDKEEKQVDTEGEEERGGRTENTDTYGGENMKEKGAEVTVSLKDMQSVDIERKVETEERGIQEMTIECGMGGGETELENAKADTKVAEAVIMTEEKTEFEKLAGQEKTEDTVMDQGDMGKDLGPTLEMKAEAVDEEGDEGGGVREEEDRILIEGTEGENTEEVGESDKSEDRETEEKTTIGTQNQESENRDIETENEEIKESIDKSVEVDEKELVRPTPVGRNDKDGLNEEIDADVKRDNITKQISDKDVHQKDIGALNTDKHEGITDIERNTEKVGESEYIGGMEDKVWVTEEKGEGMEVRTEHVIIFTIDEEIHDDLGIEVPGETEKEEMEGYEEGMKESKMDSEEGEPTQMQSKKCECRETKKRIITGLENKATEGLNVKNENEEMKESVNKGVEDNTDGKEFVEPKQIGGNDKDGLNEETDADVKRDNVSKQTETNKDVHQKDIGKLNADKYEGITDIERNKKNMSEMPAEDKEKESEECSKEIRKIETEERHIKETTIKYDEDKREIERENITTEKEEVEAVWQEVEVREEMEHKEEKYIKAQVRKVYQKGAPRGHAVGEEEEITREEWKEDIERDEKGVKSDAVQIKVILDGDGQDREDVDGRMSVEEQEEEEQFAEIVTEGKEVDEKYAGQEKTDDAVMEKGDMGKDLGPTLEMEAEAVDEQVNEGEKDREEEDRILIEGTGGENTEKFGESEKSEDRETEEKTTIGTQNQESESLYIKTENEEMKESLDKGEDNTDGEEFGEPKQIGRNEKDGLNEGTVDVEIDDVTKEEVGKKENEQRMQVCEITELHLQLDTPSLDFTAQKSRIALKNPNSRPPSDPRTLLHTPSLLPTPSTSPWLGQLSIAPVAVKQRGPEVIRFRLPGMGEGLPALKRTQRGSNEREGVTSQNSGKELTSDTPGTNMELMGDIEDGVGGKVVGIGAAGVKLPGFYAGFPGLRKTERGEKMREWTPEEDTTSCSDRTERSDRTGADGAKDIVVPAIKLPGLGLGFPVLRKTDRGARMRGEDTEYCIQHNSEVEQTITDVGYQEALSKTKSRWTPPEKAGIGIDNHPMMSELKNKFMNTEKE